MMAPGHPHPKPLPPVHGALIAGGRSRRMGRDKRFILVEGQPLLARMIMMLKAVLPGEPVVVGDNLEASDVPGARLLRDAKPGCGPLGGLVSALEDAGEGWLLAVAVDLPGLTASDLEALLAAERCDCDVLTLGLGERPEPLAALYACATAPFWRERLEREKLGLMAGLAERRVKVVEPPSGRAALRNLNRPEDLE